MKGFKLYLLWFLRFLMSFNMNTYQPWKVWRKAQKDISLLFDLNWSLLYHKLQLLNTTNFVCVTKFFNKVVKSSVESLCLILCFLLQPLFYGQCLVFPGVISIWRKKKIRRYPKSWKSVGIWGYQSYQMKVVFLKHSMIAVSATPGRWRLPTDLF